jgi:uncharacterized protein YbjT (DUF2867 family)
MSYRAIVLGATGAVGSALVRELLASPSCSAVVALARRPLDAPAGADGAEKLTSEVVDLDKLEAETTRAGAGCDAAFCTMGIGQPTKVPKEELWKVDVELASAFARGCKAAGVKHVSLLTAASANARSGIYYLKVKGSVEEAFAGLGFARTSFFRPGVLATKEARYGLQDRVTQSVYPLLSWMLPARWHEISVEQLGRAMRINAERAGQGVEVLEYRQFQELLTTAEQGATAPP